MRVLFDQGTPTAIADYLSEHTVRTTKQQGWETLSNGDLLTAAEGAGFEVLVTTDNNIAFQQNLKGPENRDRSSQPQQMANSPTDDPQNRRRG